MLIPLDSINHPSVQEAIRALEAEEFLPFPLRGYENESIGPLGLILRLTKEVDEVETILEEILTTVTKIAVNDLQDQDFTVYAEDRAQIVKDFLYEKHLEEIKSRIMFEMTEFFKSLPEEKKLSDDSSDFNFSRLDKEFEDIFANGVDPNDIQNPFTLSEINKDFERVNGDKAIYSEREIVERIMSNNEFLFTCIDKLLRFNPLAVIELTNSDKEKVAYFHPKIHKLYESVSIPEPAAEHDKPTTLNFTDPTKPNKDGVTRFKMDRLLISTQPTYVDLHVQFYDPCGSNEVLKQKMRERFLMSKQESVQEPIQEEVPEVVIESTPVQEESAKKPEQKSKDKKGSTGLKKNQVQSDPDQTINEVGQE